MVASGNRPLFERSEAPRSSAASLRFAHLCDDRIAQYLHTITHRVSRTALGAVLWALASLTLWHNSSAHAANPTIEAILGGGTVLGTECVDGKVVESLYPAAAAFTEFGPQATLFVQSTEKAGVGVKTRLRRTAGAGWTDSTSYLYRDAVVFNPIAGGTVSNLKHYLVRSTGAGTDAQFGAEDGGFAKVPSGQGEWMMSFAPYGGGAKTDLGVMYTATMNDDWSWSCVGSDPTPEDQTPDAPTITDLVPGNQSLSATYSAAPATTYAIASYQYRLDVKDGAEGTWTAITGTLPTDEQTADLELTGLTNGTTYVLTIRAIDSQGGEGDPSNSVSDTPRIVCANTTFPAVGSAEADSFQCTHNDVTYEFADFHILTSNDTGVCTAPASYLPTGDSSGQGLFCAQDGTTVRAIYDWDNGLVEYNAKHQLTWLDSVQQIGSRSLEPSNDACGALGTTVAGRCANQLKIGEDAFRGMAGVGGSAIANLDTSNLNNIEHIFHDATQFNQNVSTKSVTVNGVTYIAWDVSGVNRINSAFWGATNFNNGGQPLYWDTGNVFNMGWAFAESAFDQDISTQQVNIGGNFTAWDTSLVKYFDNMFNGARQFNQDLSNWATGAKINNDAFDRLATGWCGLGFTNRGRPARFRTYPADNCALHLELVAQPAAEPGDAITYQMTYYNESAAAVTNGELTLKFPSTLSFVDASAGGSFTSPDTITWNSLTIPAGSSEEAAGTAVATLSIPGDFPSETDFNVTATLYDGGAIEVSRTQRTHVTAKAHLYSSIDGPSYAIAGGTVDYTLEVQNKGRTDAQDVMVEVTWEGGGVIPVSGAQNCSGSPIKCVWGPMSISKLDGQWTETLSVTLPQDAEQGNRVKALLSATAANGADLSDNPERNDSARTQVNALPDLSVVLATLPRTIVKPSGTVQTKITVTNVGAGVASEVGLALPLSGGVSAAVPDGAYCDANTDPCASSYLFWNLGTMAAGAEETITLPVTAPASADLMSLQAQLSFKDSSGERSNEDSNFVPLQVGERPVVELTGIFSPARFDLGGDTSILLEFANIGTAEATSGQLSFKVPEDAALKTWPSNTECDGNACSQGFTGNVTLSLGTLAERGAEASEGSASFGLTVSETAEELEMVGFLRPTTTGEFLPRTATAIAKERTLEEEIGDHRLEIIPPEGSNCSLDIVETRPAYSYSGWTLVLDELLRFTVVECESGVTLGVKITVSGSDPLPEDSVVAKTSGAADDSLAEIAGSNISGQVVTYQLTDNDGLLDRDDTPGELDDPLGVALRGGSGIYMPFVPVPIPYWVLGLLAGLMGWLGYRRLRAA